MNIFLYFFTVPFRFMQHLETIFVVNSTIEINLRKMLDDSIYVGHC